GTAGAVGLLDQTDDLILVINGDILTNLDFKAMVSFHKEHAADMTVGVRLYEMKVPYGVVKSDGIHITELSEKPTLRYFINAGIYLLNPSVCELVPNGKSYDMPDLIERLLQENRCVVSFPVHEYWVDIGQLNDYKKA